MHYVATCELTRFLIHFTRCHSFINDFTTSGRVAWALVGEKRWIEGGREERGRERRERGR